MGNKWNGIERRSNWTNALNIRLIELKTWIQVEINKLKEEQDSIEPNYWEGIEQGFLEVIEKIEEMENKR